MVSRTPTTTPVIENQPTAEEWLRGGEWVRIKGGSVAHLLAKRLDDHYIITRCSRTFDWFRCYDPTEPVCCSRCLESLRS